MTSMVGPVGGGVGGSGSGYHQVLKTTSMAGPWGALPMGPAVSTTEVEVDIDGGPARRRCRWVRQWPPPSLKTTSIAGPHGGTVSGSDNGCHRVLKTTSMVWTLGALPAGPTASTTEVEDDINGGPPWGALSLGLAASTAEFEDDVDGGPLGGTTGGSGSVHH
jgi:hypothetical protein